MPKENCHDCGAKPGEKHKPGCDVERCPACGGQALMCLSTSPSGHKIVASCCDEIIEEDELIPWSGEFPGKMECREFGWYSKFSSTLGCWVSCDKDEPGSTESLNRLYEDAIWDRGQKRFIKKGNNNEE
jgi:hypothetical protein